MVLLWNIKVESHFILFLQLMKNIKPLLLVIILFCLCFGAYAQSSNATLYGVVTNEKGEPLEMVNVALKNYSIGTSTNRKGEYLLRIPSGRDFVVGFSALGYEVLELTFNLNEEEAIERNVILVSKSEQLGEVVITDKIQNSGNVVRIDAKQIDAVTNTGIGTIEGVLKTLPGVTSANEMSSQYSVRGGNFDENLVYVNGIEVYRPYLVRSGQQEGLSFVNTDMVSSIEFAAGGFDAKYGDKMSSVLDIKYHRPNEFKASVSASMLGGKAHVEDISKNGKFTYNMGLRYKTFRYLLASLDEEASYNPNFLDYQGYFTYKLSDKLELNFLGTASSNSYNYYPVSDWSQTGLWNDQISLFVGYEGQEQDRFQTFTGAFTVNYQPAQNTFLKFSASAFNTNEAETYDIIGQYLLNEVQKEGTKEQDDSTLNIGYGFFQEHGRNYFKATVLNFSHTGGVNSEHHFVQWGIDAKKEFISDKMKEWEYRDSAGYSLPYSNSQV